MKVIHVIFTDEEHEEILRSKEKSGLNWHDFIIAAAEKMNEG
jgi:hypothetical protein